jgi:adenosylcobinamide-GDP ribazoletransferase
MKTNEILEDISIAVIVLTRVPINNIFVINQDIEIHRGQWAYPFVGALIGFFLFLLISFFESLGISREISILISLSMGILLTGALHEDGVADFFDSLAGKDHTTRQKILKDSRLGTYGVLALIIAFLLRFFLILQLDTRLALACGLIASSSLGRFSILLLVNYCDLSKQAGLTKHLKKVDNRTIVLCGIFCVVWIIPTGLPAILITIIFGYAFLYLFMKFIIPFNKGLSGDILGLCVVLIEIFSLIVISASLN